MKKIYIIPSVSIKHVDLLSIIANSVEIDPDPVDPGTFEVKGQRNSGDNYNVWNDDWSN